MNRSPLCCSGQTQRSVVAIGVRCSPSLFRLYPSLLLLLLVLLSSLLLSLSHVEAAADSHAGGRPSGCLRGPLHLDASGLLTESTAKPFAELIAAQTTRESADGVVAFVEAMRRRTATATAAARAQAKMEFASTAALTATEGARGGEADAEANTYTPSSTRTKRTFSGEVANSCGGSDPSVSCTPGVSIFSTEPTGYIGFGSTLSSLLLLGRFDETIEAVYVDGVRVTEFEVESRYALRIGWIPAHPNPPEECLFAFKASHALSGACGGGEAGDGGAESGAEERAVSILITASIEGQYAVDSHGATIMEGASAETMNVSFTLDGLGGHAWLVRRSDYTPVLLAVRSPIAVMEAFAPFESTSAFPTTAASSSSEKDSLVWGDASTLSLRGRRYNQQVLLKQYKNSMGSGQRLQEEEASVSRVFARMGKITYSTVREWSSMRRSGFFTNPFSMSNSGNASESGTGDMPAFAVVSPHIIPAEGFATNITMLCVVGETTGDLLTSTTVASLISRRDLYSLMRVLPTLTSMAMVQGVPAAAAVSRSGLRFANVLYMFTEWYHTLDISGAFARTATVGDGVRVRLHPIRFPAFTRNTEWYIELDTTSGDCQLLSASNTGVTCEVTLDYADYYAGYPTYTTDPMDSCGGGVVVSASVQQRGGEGEASAALMESVQAFTRHFPIVSAEETLFKPDTLFVTHPSIFNALRDLSRVVSAEQSSSASSQATGETAEDLSVTFTYSFVYQNRYAGDYQLHCFSSNSVSVDIEANGDIVDLGGGGSPPSSSSSPSSSPAQAALETVPGEAPRTPTHRQCAADGLRKGRRSTRRRPRDSASCAAAAAPTPFLALEAADAAAASSARTAVQAAACEVRADSALRNTRSNTMTSYATLVYFNVSCSYPLSHLINGTLRGALFCGVALEAKDIILTGGILGESRKTPLPGPVAVMEMSVPFADLGFFVNGTTASASEDGEWDAVSLTITFDDTEERDGSSGSEGGKRFVTLAVPRVTTAAECLLASEDLYLATTMAGRRWWTGPGGGGTPVLSTSHDGVSRCSWFLAVPLEGRVSSSLCRGGNAPLTLSVHRSASSLSSSSSSSSPMMDAYMSAIQTQWIYCGSRSYFMDPITALQVRVPLGFIPLLVDLDVLEPQTERGLLIYHYCVEVEFEELEEGRPSAIQVPMRSADGTFVGGPLIYTLVDTSEAPSQFQGWVRWSSPGTDTPQDSRVFGEVQYYTGLSFLYYKRGGPAPADDEDVPITARDVVMKLAPVMPYDCWNEDEYWVSPSAYLPFLHAHILNDTALSLDITDDVPGGWYNFTMFSGDIGELWVDCGLSLRVNFSITDITVPDFSPVAGGATVTIRGRNLPLWASGELYVLLGSSDVSFHSCEVTYTSPQEIQCTTPHIDADTVRKLSIGRTPGNEYYMIPLKVSLYAEMELFAGYDLFQEIGTADLDDGASWFFVPYQIIEAKVTDVAPTTVSCMDPSPSIVIHGVNIYSRSVFVCQNSALSDVESRKAYDGCTLCLPRAFSKTEIICDLLGALARDTYSIFLFDQVTTLVPNFTITSVCKVTALLPEVMYAYGSPQLIMQGMGFHPGSATEMTVYVQPTSNSPFASTLRTYVVPILLFNETTIIGRTPDLGSWLTEKVTLKLSVSYGQGGTLSCDTLGCGIRVIPPDEMPEIASFSPLSGQAPLTITVYGRGFRKLASSPRYDLAAPPPTTATTSSAPRTTYIDVGHGPCRIVDALNTRLICLLEEPCYNSFPDSSLALIAGDGLGSTARPSSSSSVSNAGSGGSDAGPLFFMCTMSASRVYPTRGSVEGGLPITITGTGFPLDTSVLSVTVAGFRCDVTSVTVRTIECTTTAISGRAGSTTGVVSVRNTATSVYTSCCSFTYDSSLTPTITSVYPLIGVRLSHITITGNHFLPPASMRSSHEAPYVYVRIGRHSFREENITDTVVRYKVSQLLFVSDVVVVYVPGVGVSAPYHVVGKASEVTSTLYSSQADLYADSLVTGNTGAELPKTPSSTAAEAEELVCTSYPKVSLLITTAVTEPAVGGFRNRQRIRVVGTNVEKNVSGDLSDMFTVNICGKPCEVEGTNSNGDVLCTTPDYIDEEFIDLYKSLLAFPTLTDGFAEYIWMQSLTWNTSPAEVTSLEVPLKISSLPDNTTTASNLDGTAVPLCEEEQSSAALHWSPSNFFLASTASRGALSTAPLGTELFLVLSANRHSRLALYEAALTFTPVTSSTIDLGGAVCRLQLATQEAEALTLFDSEVCNPLNSSMWRTDSAGSFTWPLIIVGVNTLSFASRDTLPVSSYIAVRCTGLPLGAITLEDASVRGYQVGLHASGGECPVDLVTAQSTSTSTASQRIHSCSNRLGQSCTTFRYDIGLTPVITGFDRVVALISEHGSRVTIRGAGFGDSASDIASVVLDKAACTPISVNDTAIVCALEGRVSTKATNEVLWRNERGRGVFLATRSFFAAVAWSSALAWMGSGLPSNGQIVVLPAGNTLLLDTSPPPLSGLLLDGVLVVTDEYDVELTVGLLAITGSGALIAGSAENPRRHRFTLTLSEENEAATTDEVEDLKSASAEPPYTKLATVYGGTLQLHGREPAVPRCGLARDANAGEKSVTLDCRVTWALGDEFAITASSLLTHELEKRTIASRRLYGATTILDFTDALLYNHTAGALSSDDLAQEPAESTDPAAASTTDSGPKPLLREGFDGLPAWLDGMAGMEKITGGATVILLTRNVRIRGDARSATSGIGASLQVWNSTSTLLSNVELYRAGKLGSLLGYAVSLQSIRHPTAKATMTNCVMHDTYHRAVVLRQTQHVIVEGLTIVGVEGHGIAAVGVLHDGLVLRRNFVSSLYQSRGGVDGEPTGLFLTSTAVRVAGNEVAVVDGNGVWYSLRSTFTAAMSHACPALEPLSQFVNNTVHRVRLHGLLLFPFHFSTDAACATNLFDADMVSADTSGSRLDSGMVSGTPVSSGLVDRSIFASCGLCGVYLPPSTGYRLRNCLFMDCGVAGVHMDYSHLPTVFDNSVMSGELPGGIATSFTTGRRHGRTDEVVSLPPGKGESEGGEEEEGRGETDPDSGAYASTSKRVGFQAFHGGRVDLSYLTIGGFRSGNGIVLATQPTVSNAVYRDSVLTRFMQCNVLGLTVLLDAEDALAPNRAADILSFSGPGVIHDVDGKLTVDREDTYLFSESPYMDAAPFCEPLLFPNRTVGGSGSEAQATNHTLCHAPSHDVQLITINSYPVAALKSSGGVGSAAGSTATITTATTTTTTAAEGEDEGGDASARCDLMGVTVYYVNGSYAFHLTIPSRQLDGANHAAPAFFFLSPQRRWRGSYGGGGLYAGDTATPSSGLNDYSEFFSVTNGELGLASETNMTIRLYRTGAAGSAPMNTTACYSPSIRATVYNSRNDGLYTTTASEASILESGFPTSPTLLRFAVHPRSYYFYGQSIDTTTTTTTSATASTSADGALAVSPEADPGGASDVGGESSSAASAAVLLDPATMQRTSENETLLSVLVDTRMSLRTNLRWVGTTWVGETATCPADEECLGPVFPFLKGFVSAATASALKEEEEATENSPLVASSSLTSPSRDYPDHSLTEFFTVFLKTFNWTDERAWLDGRYPPPCAPGNHTSDDPPVEQQADAPSSTSALLPTKQYTIPFGHRVILAHEDTDIDGALIIFGELLITTDVDDDGDGEASDELRGDAGTAMTVRIGSLAVFGRLTVKATRPNSRPISILLGYGRLYDGTQNDLASGSASCSAGALAVSCHNIRKPIRLDENTVLRCGSFYASGTVKLLGYAPAPTVWRGEGVAAKGSHATPAMRSLFEPWQGESILATYDGVVSDAASRLPQWCSAVPVTSSASDWDRVSSSPGDWMGAAEGKEAHRAWREGDYVAATSTSADLNEGEVNTAATSAFFTLAFSGRGNYTRMILPSSEGGLDGSENGGSGHGVATREAMVNAWAREHGATDVHNDLSDTSGRHVFSEFAVLTKRVEFDCYIPLSDPQHGCMVVITPQRLPANLFAPPAFTAVGVGFSHMGKGGQYTAGDPGKATARCPGAFPGISFLPGVYVNTTTAADGAGATVDLVVNTTLTQGTRAAAETIAIESRGQPAASFASCAFVQSYGTPLYTTPQSRMLWVLDTVIWESFGGGIRLDGGSNGTRVEGVLIAGTRYYRRGQSLTAPASRRDPLVRSGGGSEAPPLPLDAIGPVSSLCSLVANFTAGGDSTSSTANMSYDDESLFTDDSASAEEEGPAVVPVAPSPAAVIARRSVFGGSESEGLCVPLGYAHAFGRNTAHSSFVGVFCFSTEDAAAVHGAATGVGSHTCSACTTTTRSASIAGLRSYLNRYIGLYSTSHTQLTVQRSSIFANSLGAVLGVDPVHGSGTTTLADSFLSGFSNCRHATRTAEPSDEDEGAGGAACQPSMSLSSVRGCGPGTFAERLTDYAAVLVLPSFSRVGLAYNRSSPLAIPGGDPARGYREVYTQGSLNLTGVTFGGVGVLACQTSSEDGAAARCLYGAAVAGSGSVGTAVSLAHITTKGIAFTNSLSGGSSGAEDSGPDVSASTAPMSAAWVLRLSPLDAKTEVGAAYGETVIRDLDGSLFSNWSRSSEGADDDPSTVKAKAVVYSAASFKLMDSSSCAVSSADPTLLRCTDLGAPFQQLVIQSLDDRQGALADVALTLPTLHEPVVFSSSAAATLGSAAAAAAELKPSSLVAVKSIAMLPSTTSTSGPASVSVTVSFTPKSSPDVFLLGVQSCIAALNREGDSSSAQTVAVGESSLSELGGASMDSGFLRVTTTLMDPYKRLTVWRDGSALEPSDAVFLQADDGEAATAAVTDLTAVDASSQRGSALSATAASAYTTHGVYWNTVTATDDVTGVPTKSLVLRIGCGAHAVVHQLAYGIVSLFIPLSSDEVRSALVRLVISVLTAAPGQLRGPLEISRTREAASASRAAAVWEDFAVGVGDSFFVRWAPYRTESTLSPSQGLSPSIEDFNVTVEEMSPGMFNPQTTYLMLRVEGGDSADYDVVAATNAINALLNSFLERESAEDVAAFQELEKSAAQGRAPPFGSAALLQRLRSSRASATASFDESRATAAPSTLTSPLTSPVTAVGSGVLTEGVRYVVLSVQLATAPEELFNGRLVVKGSISSSYATWRWLLLVLFIVLVSLLFVSCVALSYIHWALQHKFAALFASLEAAGGSPQVLARIRRRRRAKAKEGHGRDREKTRGAAPTTGLRKALPDSAALPVKSTDPSTSSAAAIGRYVKRWGLARESLSELALANSSAAGVASSNTARPSPPPAADTGHEGATCAVGTADSVGGGRRGDGNGDRSGASASGGDTTTPTNLPAKRAEGKRKGSARRSSRRRRAPVSVALPPSHGQHPLPAVISPQLTASAYDTPFHGTAVAAAPAGFVDNTASAGRVSFAESAPPDDVPSPPPASASPLVVMPSLLVRRPAVSRSGVAPPTVLGQPPGSLLSVSSGSLAGATAAGTWGAAAISTPEASVGPYHSPTVYPGMYHDSRSVEGHQRALDERPAAAALPLPPPAPAGGVRGRGRVSFAADEEGADLSP